MRGSGICKLSRVSPWPLIYQLFFRSAAGNTDTPVRPPTGGSSAVTAWMSSDGPEGSRSVCEAGEGQGSLWTLFKRLKGSQINMTEKCCSTGTAEPMRRQ